MVVSRRPLTFYMGRVHSKAELASPPAPVDPVKAVVAALAAVHAAQAELLNAVAAVMARPDESLAREEVRENFASSRTSSRDQPPPKKSVSQEIYEETENSLTREPREDAREVREPRDHVRVIVDDDEDLDELIAPLVELCRRRHLVGVTNRSRLRRA